MPVFAQPTNKYWTDQLKPLRGALTKTLVSSRSSEREEGGREKRKKEEIDETQGVSNTSAP